MKIQRFIIILVAVLGALAVSSRPATDNKTFERFYNLSPKEFFNQLNYYNQYNQTDSAMQCANIQASKYGKKKLTTEEVEACCAAFRYMELEYLQSYCNYQLASENLLKAEQIADKNEFKQLQTLVAMDRAILAATQNDLENNFAYNENVLDGFKKAFNRTVNQITSHNTEINKINTEITAPNLLYLAIKFDKTKEVTNEVQTYRNAQKRYGVSYNVAEIICKAIDYYNAGDYDKALEALQMPITRTPLVNDRNFAQAQAMFKIAQYAVLLKCGRRAEALKLLLQHEQAMRDNKMTFEQLEALQLIWQHYEVDGNKAMADKYALQYYVTKDEFINKSQAGKIDQAKLNLELEQTRERIREMSYRQRMQTIVMWGSVIIALLAFALLGMLYMNYRKTKRTNRLLYEKNIALLAANQELRPVAAVTAPDEADEKPEPDEKPANDSPTPADTDLMEKITAVLESSPEVFGEGFSRQRLAELVGSNYKVVSRAINSCKGCNFNALLNEYRIKEACRRLMDAENYGSYTIEGIARSVGYMSRTNFASVFKDIVGLTPSAFQKLCREGKTPTA